MPTTRNNHSNAEAAEAGDYAWTFAEEAAKASEQAMRVGLDIARRAAEAARENIESAVQGFQRATEQLTQAAGPEAQELTRQSSENIGAVSGQHCASQWASGSFAGVVRSRQGTVGEEHRSLRPARALPFAAGPYRRAK